MIRTAAVLAAALLVGSPGAASARQQVPAQREHGVVVDVDLRLERNGGLSVTEHVTVPPGGTVRRSVALRRPLDSGGERVFTVTEVRARGHGEARVSEGALAMTLHPGESTVTYTVGGAVAAGDQHTQVLYWLVAAGWNTVVSKVEASFIAPRPATAIECQAGRPGSTGRCDQFQIAHSNAVRATQFDLPPGGVMALTMTLPAGTVPVNARFDEPFSVARSFALTPAGGAGLTGLALLLVGGFGLLWYTRGRDARVLAGDVGPVDVLLGDGHGGVTFASPDGVLPGQVGTVIDEYVDVVDVTATVVDLAVRNYLWIEELSGERQGRDWRIVLLNPPDEALRPYERAVLELLLDGPRDEVLLSDLRAGTLDLSPVRDALYRDVVDKHWFTRRPDSERNLFWWAGIGLAGVGVVLTAILALVSSLALLGIGVALGGIALTAGARLMPARARRGSALVAQMRGLREYLRGVAAASIAGPDRETVFSRSLPYALVLGETDRWLAEFAELDPGADGTPGLYWYGELVEEDGHVVPNLRRFRTHFPLLISALDGIFAEAGRRRSLT